MFSFRGSLRPLLHTVFTVISASLTWGQITAVNNSTSTPIPGAGHDYIKLLSETVDPANGSLSLRLQVPVPQGRGLSIPFSFAYDSNGVVFPKPYYSVPGLNTWGTAQINSGTTLLKSGWSYSVPMLSYDSLITPIPPNIICQTATGFVLQDAAGSRHSLNVTHIVNTDVHCTGFPLNQVEKDSGGDKHYQAYLQFGTTPFVVDAHGTVYNFPYFGIGGNGEITSLLPTSIEDSNGNVVKFTPGAPNTGAFTETDDLKRSVLSVSGFGQTGDTVTIPGLSPYIVTWGTANLNFTSPNYNVTPVTTGCTFDPTDSGTGAPVIKTIQLPNSQKVTFTYEGVFSLINQIKYPSGGYVKYTWGFNQYAALAQFPADQPVQPPPQCQFVYSKPAVTDRDVSFDGTTIALHQHFTYATAWNGSQWTSKQTTVMTTDNVRGMTFTTIYSYRPIPGPQVPNELPPIDNQIPVENTIVYQDNNGVTLRTVTKGWLDQYTLSSEKTTLENNSSSLVTYLYGPGVQVREKSEYDFGSGGVGPLLRKTVTNYQSFAATPIYSFSTSIFDRPCQVIVYDVGANPVAETDYLYDSGVAVCGAAGSPSVTSVNNLPPGTHDEGRYGPSSTAARGNLTKVIEQCFPSSPACASGNPTTAFAYDETGQKTSATDPKGKTTQFSYADSYTVLSGGVNIGYNPGFNKWSPDLTPWVLVQGFFQFFISSN